MDQIIRPIEMAAAGQDKCRRIQVYPEVVEYKCIPKNSPEELSRRTLKKVVCAYFMKCLQYFPFPAGRASDSASPKSRRSRCKQSESATAMAACRGLLIRAVSETRRSRWLKEDRARSGCPRRCVRARPMGRYSLRYDGIECQG